MAQDTRLTIRKTTDAALTGAEAANSATMRVIDTLTSVPRRGMFLGVHFPATGVDATKTATIILNDAANAGALLAARTPGAFADTGFQIADTMKATDRVLFVRFSETRPFLSARATVTAGGNFGLVSVFLRNEKQVYI